MRGRLPPCRPSGAPIAQLCFFQLCLRALRGGCWPSWCGEFISGGPGAGLVVIASGVPRPAGGPHAGTVCATGSSSRWAAISLVLVAGLAVAVSLLIRPPADVHSAGWRLVTGLTFAVPARAGQPGRLLPLPGRPVGLAAADPPVLHAASRSDKPRADPQPPRRACRATDRLR